jgi:NADPH:quinone reductase-like Zn-dependent oxidoreductase
MISIERLTKRYGPTLAVDDVSFTADSGRVTRTIDSTYRLDQVPEAMRHLAAGHVRGKVAITV